MKLKLKEAFRKLRDTIKPYEKNLIIPLLKIILIIVICMLIVRFLGGHETLAEFAAKKNPTP